MGCSQVVRHRNLDPTGKGSNPFTPVSCVCLDSSAVEQRTENPWVRGSNPLLDKYSRQRIFYRYPIYKYSMFFMVVRCLCVYHVT